MRLAVFYCCQGRKLTSGLGACNPLNIDLFREDRLQSQIPVHQQNQDVASFMDTSVTSGECACNLASVLHTMSHVSGFVDYLTLDMYCIVYLM